jgi:hypothetical protein
MLACGIQGKADQESKTLFAEMLTNRGSFKIQFYYQVNVGDRYPPGPLKEKKTSRKAQRPNKS